MSSNKKQDNYKKRDNKAKDKKNNKAHEGTVDF